MGSGGDRFREGGPAVDLGRILLAVRVLRRASLERTYKHVPSRVSERIYRARAHSL